MKRTLLSTAVVVAAIFCTAGMASAGLINYYSFDSDTLVDEAALYSQNAGTTLTNTTMGDGAGQGTTFVTGLGGEGKALYVKLGQALNWTSNDADLNLGQNFTVEMWIRSAEGQSFNGQTYSTFMSATNISVGKTGYYDGMPQTLRIGASSINPLDFNASTTSGPLGTGWNHLAFVARDGQGYYYYNGVEYAVGATGILPTAIAMSIGINDNPLSYPAGVRVYLDDIAMWNEGLSAATIQSHATGNGYGLTTLDVPEPATLCLLALGGVAAWIRKRKA
ncbi:MAG: LamG-like jellyroll fold domain-containing protein [Planctomycetaceae bacterium]|nr:PEP-CTERM sorting domain-containing protein [Planctomycetaceae bacterium]